LFKYLCRKHPSSAEPSEHLYYARKILIRDSKWEEQTQELAVRTGNVLFDDIAQLHAARIPAGDIRIEGDGTPTGGW
jgi:hypothetical protein